MAIVLRKNVLCVSVTRFLVCISLTKKENTTIFWCHPSSRSLPNLNILEVSLQLRLLCGESKQISIFISRCLEREKLLGVFAERSGKYLAAYLVGLCSTTMLRNDKFVLDFRAVLCGNHTRGYFRRQ